MNRSQFKSAISVMAIVIAWVTPAYTQSTVAIGQFPMASFSGGPFDVVDNGNLNAHLSIPIVGKAGPSLPFRYFLSYDSSIWYPANVNGTMTWTPMNSHDWGWSAVAENVGTGGYVSYTTLGYSCLANPGSPYPSYYNWYDTLDFVYHDSAGGSHPFNVAVTTFPPSGAPCGSDSNPNSATGVATDNSGFTISTSSQPSGSVMSPQGITFNVPFTNSPSPAAASESNPNGNQISSSVSGQTTTYMDALGMTALSVSATGSPTTQETYTYSGVGNVQEQAVVKYSTYTIRTHFGCSVQEFGPTNENLISEIDMPDIGTNPSDKYTFTYEPTPGYSGDYTGRLASITLPTGGTITYTYSGGSNGIECSDGSTAGLTRTLSPGGAWTYSRNNVSGLEWTTSISNPNGDVTTMYFQFATPSGATAALPYETERDLPGGAASTVTCYNGNPSPCTNTSRSTGISFPITRRTAMRTIGSLTSMVDTQFDSTGYGLPVDVKEYDWGASTLVGETQTSYALGSSCGVTNSSVIAQVCSSSVSGTNSQGQWTSPLSSTVNTYNANGNLLSSASSGLTKSFTYNSNGTVATSTDVNGKVTTYAYNGTGGCSSAYPTSITGPTSLTVSMQWDCYAGVKTNATDPNTKVTSFGYDGMKRLTSTNYPDGASVTSTYTPTQVQVTTKITSGVSRIDTTTLDGMGRTSSQISAGAETDLTYDSLGRLSTLSVKNSGQQDTRTYDALSRLTSVTHADNTHAQIGYNNNCSTTTDESGKAREVCVDGLGRTSQAIEDPLGLNYSTTYAYDGLSDLIAVTQGSESRSFTYDGLGRMTKAVTPEAGTVNYTYDSDTTCGSSTGDLVKRVDARGIRTCYGYDFIHRLTSNSYSDGTPTANYYYDQSSYNGLTISNGLGRQTGMSDGSGQTAWSFDPKGRTVTQVKTISGVTKTISYSYNYDGSTASITYPSGRMITYGVDSLGRPATAQDTAGGINYVTGSCSGAACYAPQNSLASLITGYTGSFGGVTYSVSYNNRLLPSSVSASSSNGTALSLSYTYFPNGSVETITNNRDNGRTATYGYDSLDRINSASSQATSGADCWGQSVPSGGYDRYGNLLQINVTKCTAPSQTLSVNANNQITNSGFGYDASGNQTSYGTTSYAWDAEGRMKSGAGVSYGFDGAGERVSASSPNSLYWYGLNGSVLSETDTSGNAVNEYVYFDGTRIARRDSSGNVYYYFGNVLGSATITTASGGVCYDADFYPYGGELAFTNTCAQNYKFAGMERDSASGLDQTFFRQYASNFGRWLDPDPLGAGASSLNNPQTLNLYTYVINRPTSLVDLLGLDSSCGAEGETWCPWQNYGPTVDPWYSAAYQGVPPVQNSCTFSYGGETFSCPTGVQNSVSDGQVGYQGGSELNVPTWYYDMVYEQWGANGSPFLTGMGYQKWEYSGAATPFPQAITDWRDFFQKIALDYKSSFTTPSESYSRYMPSGTSTCSTLEQAVWQYEQIGQTIPPDLANALKKLCHVNP